ncbi:MAG: hypothetical protein WD009_04830 [Phycisphaeraceae bacterium]
MATHDETLRVTSTVDYERQRITLSWHRCGRTWQFGYGSVYGSAESALARDDTVVIVGRKFSEQWNLGWEFRYLGPLTGSARLDYVGVGPARLCPQWVLRREDHGRVAIGYRRACVEGALIATRRASDVDVALGLVCTAMDHFGRDIHGP